MNGNALNGQSRRFVDELDEAASWHMAWTRSLLRCAVLRTPLGDEVLADDAHCRCQFDGWLQRHRESVVRLDGDAALRLQTGHERMHEVAREVCRKILAGRAVDAAELDAFEAAQAGVVADLARLKTACLARSARLDALTGLPLRHGLDEEFERSRAQALRHGEKLFALMLDLDEFKHVNDRYGHAAGDLALQHFAALLRGHCRVGDPVFRFGGEEFLALLQAADRDAARRAVERILQALREEPLRLPDGREFDLRASAGVAEIGAVETLAASLARADEALYAAKRAGRDTWRWAGAAK